MDYAAGNSSTLTLGARLGEIRSQAAAAYTAWRTYRNTLNELDALTARELEDLGINRSAIRQIALEAAYGKAG